MEEVNLLYFMESIMKSIMQSTTFLLKDLAILDSEATIHIFNNLLRFSNFQKTPYDNYLLAETSKMPILKYEDINV